MASEQPEKGDKVSWQWGGGAPGGKVVETKDEGEIAIKSKKGNTIKKNASPSNPAVHVGREGNDVVKRASELNVENKASKSKSPAPAADSKKRDHDQVDDKKDDKKKEPAPKKAKKESAKKAKADDKQANGDEPKKGRGRPKGGAAGAPKKKKASKPRATEGIGSRTRSRA